MRIIISLIISLLLSCLSLIHCQPMYINFIPYSTETCSGEPLGVGFTLLADECINDIQGLPQTTESTSYSWFLDTDDGVLVPSVTIKLNKDSDRTKCDKESYESQVLYVNNTCNVTPFFSNVNGSVVGLLPNQYSIMLKTLDPLYPVNSIVYSVFRNGNCNFGQLLYSMYVTNGLEIKNLESSQQFSCLSNQAYVENCKYTFDSTNCNEESTETDICNQTTFGKVITFCQPLNSTNTYPQSSKF